MNFQQHQQIVEKNDLNTRINDLESFLNSSTLDAEDKNLATKQYALMLEYSKVLTTRINRYSYT